MRPQLATPNAGRLQTDVICRVALPPRIENGATARASQPQKMFDGKVPGHEIIIRLPNHFNAYSIVSTDFRRCHWKRFFEDSRAKDSADASPWQRRWCGRQLDKAAAGRGDNCWDRSVCGDRRHSVSAVWI
jgi:hypothetical protein